MGFADCKDIAVTVSGAIPDSGIYYGLYTPITPRKTWHKTWQDSPDPTFTHFWVEREDKIIDYAVDQFGGGAVAFNSLDDPRYTKVGKYEPIGDRHIILVDNPRIEWGTLNNHKVKVTWIGYEKYLEDLLGA